LAAFTLKELENMITVNMGDYKTARGDKKLITRDLGSCVAVAMRDSAAGVGGLLHIMLPRHIPNEALGEFVAAKYADTGIEEMVKVLIRQGAKKGQLTAKLAGAAHMVKTQNVPESMDISSRNLSAVKSKLSMLNIPVVSQDVGGYSPRTVVFYLENGSFQIITMGEPDKFI
jgi:chemotaxis protein CheD